MRFLIAVLVCLGLSKVPAQEPAPPAEPKVEQKKAVVETGKCNLVLLDGSSINAVLAEDTFEVETRYGKLVVPWADVQSIKLGLHYPDNKQEEIKALLTKLGDKTYKTREEATRDLLSLGRISYVMVGEQMKNSDLEIARRAEKIKEDIEKNVPTSDIRTVPYDTITSKEGVIRGTLIKKTIKLKTAHLGNLDLPIHAIDRISTSPGDSSTSVDAAKYGLQAVAWFDTGIHVDTHHHMVITASGQVDLWPQQAGQYMAGPNGMVNNNNGAGQAGMLVAKIGDGSQFTVGEACKASVANAGKLFLRIMPPPWPGSVPSGTYEVKIRIVN